jgi:hypothetical protein
MAEDVLGYLKKYPNKGHVVNLKPPTIYPQYKTVKLKEGFGGQYKYFHEDLDPQFPPPLVPEMDINIFVNTDHAHDKMTIRSIYWTLLLCQINTSIMEIPKTSKCSNLHLQC